MPNIVISYRRNDSDAITGRIRDRIVGHYGEQSVFMDIDSIPFGRDFREHVKDAILQNDLVLAVIGPKWLGGGRGATATRIHDDNDPVRMEIEIALERGIPVIPILVGDATMPKASDLPPILRDLVFRNAAEVKSGRDFNQHMERLLRSMDRLFEIKMGVVTEASAPLTARAATSTGQPASIGRLTPGSLSPLSKLMVRVGLRFPDPSREQRFQDVFRDHYYWVAQMAMALGILGWLLFGPVDLWSENGGIESTRFRFMMAGPLLGALFAISFTAWARRNWQPFVGLFGVTGILCMTYALTLVTREAWFRIEQATMCYMIFLVLVGLAPFTMLYTLGVGAIVIAFYGWFLLNSAAPAFLAIFCSAFVLSFYILACCGAYARERNFRAEFTRPRQ
jgi:hypothetical protein